MNNNMKKECSKLTNGVNWISLGKMGEVKNSLAPAHTLVLQ